MGGCLLWGLHDLKSCSSSFVQSEGGLHADIAEKICKVEIQRSIQERWGGTYIKVQAVGL